MVTGCLVWTVAMADRTDDPQGAARRRTRRVGREVRKNPFNDAIAAKVLERARDDVRVTVAGISDLRDPIEWLSLGELLEVVQSRRFKGLSGGELNWVLLRMMVLSRRPRGDAAGAGG